MEGIARSIRGARWETWKACERLVSSHYRAVHRQSIPSEDGHVHSEQMRVSIRETIAHRKTVSKIMDVTVAEHVVLDEVNGQGPSLETRKTLSRHVSSAAACSGVTIAVEHRA
jgi:hypothetical protein